MSSLINDLKNIAVSEGLKLAERFTPVLKESKFRETGFLTPDEFVAAGDFLTGHCPTWKWAPVPNPKACKDYLPKDRQFLLIKNVPCSKRCRHLIDNIKDNQEKVIEEETGEGGWVDTHYYNETKGESNGTDGAGGVIQEITNDEPKNLNNVIKRDDNDEDEDEDEEEAIDMDAYDHNVVEDDDEATVIRPVVKKNEEKKSEINEETDVFIPTRTYDLHITYDNYYRTPRLWLIGYDENNKPLTIEQMYDDISEDHAKKTVTFENHPHIPGTLMASIHPCRHADVMKKLINLVSEGGKELEVHNYLMVFLKFVQSVIPTIEYDYTRNITI